MYRFLQYFLSIIICTLRLTASGISIMFNGLEAALAPLLMIPAMYSPHLPQIINEVLPILSGLIILLPPETRNQPLPNTIQDVEKRRVNALAAPREEVCSSFVIRKAKDNLEPSVLHAGSDLGYFQLCSCPLAQ